MTLGIIFFLLVSFRSKNVIAKFFNEIYIVYTGLQALVQSIDLYILITIKVNVASSRERHCYLLEFSYMKKLLACNVFEICLSSNFWLAISFLIGIKVELNHLCSLVQV